MMMLVVEWAFWSKDEYLATHLHYQRIEAEPWILTFHTKSVCSHFLELDLRYWHIEAKF